MSAPEPSRTVTYALTALCFAVVAPVFWLAVERPHEAGGPRGANEPLYAQTLPSLHAAFAAHGEATPESRRIAYQPLNLVFRLVLPVERAMAWHAALCLAMAGTGLAWFLRSLGTRGAAALFGGAVYAFGGTAAAAMSRVELACVLAWAPWAVWAAAACARGTSHMRYAVLAGVFGGLALLSGAHLHALPVLALAAGILLIARPEAGPLPLTRRIPLLALAAAIAAVLSAVSWAPALLADGARDVPGLATAGVPRVLNLVSADADDLPRAGYMGVAALLVLPAAFAGRGAGRTALYLGMALAACWTGALYLARPDGWVLAGTLCVAALAGLGAETLLAPARDWRSPRVTLPVLAAGALCLAVLLLGDAGAVGRLPFAAAPIVLAIALRTPRTAAVAALLLTAFTVADLAAASRNRFPHPYFDYTGNAPAISRPHETGGQEIQHAPGARWPGAESADSPRN